MIFFMFSELEFKFDLLKDLIATTLPVKTFNPKLTLPKAP